MKIKIGYKAGYKTMYKYAEISRDNTVITTGLLDEKESVEMAKELLSAAEGLLKDDDVAEVLANIREAL